jgi:predicted NBD/HSP70 family sugar kinase
LRLARCLPDHGGMVIAAELVIGMDVGASTISAGLVDPDGTVVLASQAPTDAQGSVTESILALLDRILAVTDERRIEVAGVGVGLPGPVDIETGSMRPMDGHWVSELGDIPLASLIRERSGHVVFVDNDVNALTLSEWMWGLGRGASSLVTVAIGTGIGGGIIVDGALIRGALNTAGEIGHVAVSLDGPVCPCGGIGCLTAYVAGRLIADRARERLAAYPDSSVLARAGGDPARIGAELLFAAAAEGDPLARAVVDQACEALAVGVGALANLLNPEVIVITGGVAGSLASLREDILARMRRRTLRAVLDATAIHFAPADKRNTVRGGAALVLYELRRRGQAAGPSGAERCT